MHRYTRSVAVGYRKLEDWLQLDGERIISMRIGGDGETRDGVIQLEVEKISSHAENDKIVKTANVCGGAACIRDTRIPVWLLIQLDRLGMGEEAILVNYPTLWISDIAAAREYYAANSEEIDQVIAGQDHA